MANMAGGDAVALQRVAGQDLDIEVLGDVLQRLAAVQAGDEVLRIFGDLGAHLIGAPVLGHLVFHLIERLELLWCDSPHSERGARESAMTITSRTAILRGANQHRRVCHG